MFALSISLRHPPDETTWQLISTLLHQRGCLGIDEGVEPLAGPQQPLHATQADADEFREAMEPLHLTVPQNFNAYFATSAEANEAITFLRTETPLAIASFTIDAIPSVDYSKQFRDTFPKISVPPFWTIRAPWHEKGETLLGNISLTLEPGMAFGTGTHETTQACLELFGELVQNKTLDTSAQILDFGCGSGILAIAALQCGFHHTLGVDIDPLAVNASYDNAKLNGLDARFYLPQDFPTPRPKSIDLIFANLLKNTILEFAPSFAAWLKPNAFVIFSGVLNEQMASLRPRLGELGLVERSSRIRGEWTSTVWSRAAH